MGSINRQLPALKTNPNFIFFTDFDGTITLHDSNDFLTDNLGFGHALRVQGNQDVLHGRRDFRTSFQEMMDSIKTPYPECIRQLLAHVKLDPGFKSFYQWAKKENVPIVVLSGGMRPIIRALLVNLLGNEKDVDAMQIVSNDVKAREGKKMEEEGGWEVVFHDDSHHGHDKSLEIKPYRNLLAEKRPTMFYAGDGVSDLSAARETDLLFAKRGRDLVTYCEKEGIPFTEFESFDEILATMKDIVEGKITVQDAAKGRK